MTIHVINLFGRPYFTRQATCEVFKIVSEYHYDKFKKIKKAHLNENNVEAFIENEIKDKERGSCNLYISPFTFFDMSCFELLNKRIINSNCKVTNFIVHNDVIEPYYMNLIFNKYKSFDAPYHIKNDFHIKKRSLEEVLQIGK